VNEYTASNGIGIEIKQDGYLLGHTQQHVEAGRVGTHATASPGGVEALREFFRAEEDERLGRWRWNENPDYVVYADVDGYGVHNVVSESDGLSLMATRKGINAHTDAHADAARAYFDAHPEPKPNPWHDAKEGEGWVLTLDDFNHQAVVVSNDGKFLFRDGGASRLDAPWITAGRRVFPEGDS
jgi:hypothetical protein